MAKKYYWLKKSALLLGGKRKLVSCNGVIPDDVIKDMPAKKLERLIKKGSIGTDPENKTTDVVAEMNKLSRVEKKLLKENKRLVEARDKAFQERDKALAGLKTEKASVVDVTKKLMNANKERDQAIKERNKARSDLKIANGRADNIATELVDRNKAIRERNADIKKLNKALADLKK